MLHQIDFYRFYNFVYRINNIEYNNSAIEEGFCNLGSALVYSKDGGKIAKFHLENMQNNPDPDYGIGYRKMNSCLKKYGWTVLIEKILNNDYLSCF